MTVGGGCENDSTYDSRGGGGGMEIKLTSWEKNISFDK